MNTFVMITKVMNGTVTMRVEINGIKTETFETALAYLKALPFYKERAINSKKDEEGFYFQLRQDDPGSFVFCQLNKVPMVYL